MKIKLFIYFFAFSTLLFISCKQNCVEGIQIDDTLYTHQSYSENKEFCKKIKETLNKNESSFKSLINWDCGDGSGCYDLGFVFTQIIYKMGESDFINMCKELDFKEKSQLKNLIRTGLEYGYDKPRYFNIEFSNLESELKQK